MMVIGSIGRRLGEGEGGGTRSLFELCFEHDFMMVAISPVVPVLAGWLLM